MKTYMDPCADFVKWGSTGGGGGDVPDPNSNFLKIHMVKKLPNIGHRHPPPLEILLDLFMDL